MPPPEVWGPAVWTLFHTLAEKINVNAYPVVFPSLFNMIVKISKYLPCPECSNDASIFLAKVRVSDLKTKDSLKALLCVFHNTVNAKKRKPIFHYSNIEVYGKFNLIKVINNFISQYQTKGNMKLLSESFQRQFVIKDFQAWFQRTIKAFIGPVSVPTPLPVESTENPVFNVEEQEQVQEQVQVQEQEQEQEQVQEEVQEQEVQEQEQEQEQEQVQEQEQEVQVQEPINVEEPIEEPQVEVTISNIQEPAIEDSVSDPIEEPVASSPVSSTEERSSIEENVSEIDNTISETNVEPLNKKTKKNKKNKNKK
jgi:hypothetical protein